MKDLFLRQARLNKWANNLLRETMKDFNATKLKIQTPYGTIFDLTIHLISAVNHWFNFFDSKYKLVKKVRDLNEDNWTEVLKIWNQTDDRFEKIIENFKNDSDFEGFFTYSHNKKDYYKMKYSNLFLHLSCHSYYHRGQLALLFRQNNINIAPPMDADDYFKIQVMK